jgi:hypothetical protein
MKKEQLYCDICGQEALSLQELELPVYSYKHIEYEWPLRYEKRNICNKCAGKIATTIFTIPLEKYKNKEVTENEEINE